MFNSKELDRGDDAQEKAHKKNEYQFDLIHLFANGELSRAGAGCRRAELDGEATRGSSGLLGGAFSLRRPQDAGEAARR